MVFYPSIDSTFSWECLEMDSSLPILYGAEICVGSALFLPVGFSSKWKKEAQIGVPGTSIRCVPTLMGEGININTHTCTHTHFIPMKKDFIKDLPVFELSKSPDKTQN